MPNDLLESPARDLIRDFPFRIRSAGGDGLTLEGYAAVFGSPTTIRGEGPRPFTETVARGAFAKTLQESPPVLMFNHGHHPMIGDMPIGVIRHMKEDNRGLFVRARLADNWLIQPVRDAIASQAITGMSFRFEAIRDEWNKARDERTLLEVRCPELGPVVMPAYAETSVGVRSREVIRLLSSTETRQDLASWRARSLAPQAVLYADPGYLADNLPRFPLDTAENVQAAWDAVKSDEMSEASYDDFQLEQMELVIQSVAPNFGLTFDDEDDEAVVAIVTSGEGQNSALLEGAVRTDTPASEPPASTPEPARATPAPTTRADRLKAVAKMKGITP